MTLCCICFFASRRRHTRCALVTGVQTCALPISGRVMIAYEKVCQERRPDWVIVVGDVNSTMACTIAAKKLLLPVAHLEAGLRSGDRAKIGRASCRARVCQYV